jgi:dihydrofolate reductase
MRKIIVLTFLSLDGVMQAPGGKEEDSSGQFEFGGWSMPYFDEAVMAEMEKECGNEPFDMLFGGTSYGLLKSYWPDHKDEGATGRGIDRATKYVVSNEDIDTNWEKTVKISGDDITGQIKRLKEEDGPMLQVHGSGMLIQSLMKNDLVDEFWLKVFPVTIGKGKRLFADGTIPAAFKLTYSMVSPSGVITAYYARDGKLKLDQGL